MFLEYQIAIHRQKNYPQLTYQVMQPKLLVETFAYLQDAKGSHHYFLSKQCEYYWMVNQVEHHMLRMDISVYWRDFKGTHYITLEQQDHNWVVDHAKYNTYHEYVKVYDNDYTWIEVSQDALPLVDSPQAGMYTFM